MLIFIFYYRFSIGLLDGLFTTVILPIPTDWTHVVLNYIGPEEGQGIQVYLDGVLAKSDDTKASVIFAAGDGRVAIGRTYPNLDGLYGDVNVDELLFFNEKLTGNQAQEIMNLI